MVADGQSSMRRTACLQHGLLALFLLPTLVVVAGCAASKSQASLSQAAREKADPPAAGDLAARRTQREQCDAEFAEALRRLHRGDREGCWTGVEQLLAHNPDYAEARLLMADLMIQTDRPAEAVAQLRRAVADHPDDPRARFALAGLLQRTGQAREAVQHYEKAAQLQPDNPQYLEGYRQSLLASRGEAASYR